ncbi:MEDS domain-containing protein [Priestia megaterium]|uniref:hypothetical protein n=1 Tax=Priestia megaterium TaxID=1404 RepID=UPI00227FD8A3|nr:hypothetical protein [Priestia megaterium]MCY9021087.1 MEDS domain-containing protein [Priestia megaterium]
MLKSKMNQLFAEQKSVHILYSYDQQENYIQQVVSYIQEGIFAGDFILLIEMEGDLITSEQYRPLTDLK